MALPWRGTFLCCSYYIKIAAAGAVAAAGAAAAAGAVAAAGAAAAAGGSSFIITSLVLSWNTR